MTRDARRIAALAVALLLSYAYFYQAGGWNQNSRFALVRAIIEGHTTRIDPYQHHTGDRALWRGHYYSDKAPGASLLAVGPVALARSIGRAAGVDPEDFPGIAWTSYVAAVVTSGVFTVVATLMVFFVALAWGSSREAALFAALAYGIASPGWCYATLFMGHNLAAGCLMLAFAGTVWLETGRVTHPRAIAWMIGISAGWAVVTEFQAAIPAAFIGLAALRASARRPSPSSIVAGLIGGAAVTAVVLGAYNAIAFGSPLHIGYQSEEHFEHLRTGLMGITYPKPRIVGELLFGSYRGLFPLAPLIVIGPVGLLAGQGRSSDRPLKLIAFATPIYYVLLNASYAYWEGGWAYGPRQIMTALPFAALGLAALWDRARHIGKALLLAGFVWGLAMTVVAISTTPQPPSNFTAPMSQLLWPAFKDGDLSLNPQRFVDAGANPNQLRHDVQRHAAWNLGEVIGLRHHASLIPLALVWIAACLILIL